MVEVEMHDGSKVTLTKAAHDYDPTNKDRAMSVLHEAREQLHFYTGLIYCNEESIPFDEQMGLVDEPLARLDESKLVPSAETFAKIMDSYK